MRAARAIGAALIAAGMVLSGCAAGGGEETPPTTSSAAAGPVSPWDLPVEQRPALFDPCTELPLEAIEQGLGGPVEPVEQYARHQPGELMACGWRTGQADISVLATWKSRTEYLADRTFTVVDGQNEIGGRTGMRMLDAMDTTERSCLQLFFTERGTVWVKFDLIDIFRKFKGEQPADACRALDQAILPIMQHYPQGGFT